MLIYEKENKLNINFNNEVSEQPDLQISKEDGKTSVTIDGQPSGGGGGGSLIVHWTTVSEGYEFRTDKTWKEIHDALENGNQVVILFTNDQFPMQSDGVGTIVGAEYTTMWPDYPYWVHYTYGNNLSQASCTTSDDYPSWVNE